MLDRSLLLALLLVASGCVVAPPPSDDDDDDDVSGPYVVPALPDDVAAELDDLRDAAGLPGLSACVFTAAGLVGCAASGLANAGTGDPVQAQTAFLLASVSKTVTSIAVLQQRDALGLDLDADVSPTLGFSLEHPAGGALTRRQLLTHTAGVADNWVAMGDFYSDGDPTLPLADAVEGYFHPDGAWYDPVANFTATPPGEAFQYANMGFALVGYLAEAEAGAPFADLTEDGILAPLRLDHTSWWIDDFDDGGLANPHDGDVPVDHFSFADYPNGALRASAPDLGRIGAALLAGGVLDGERILAEATAAEMAATHFALGAESVGLGLFTGADGWIGHGGGELGTVTTLSFHPALGAGYCVLLNGDGTDGAAVAAVFDRVREAALAAAP